MCSVPVMGKDFGDHWAHGGGWSREQSGWTLPIPSHFVALPLLLFALELPQASCPNVPPLDHQAVLISHKAHPLCTWTGGSRTGPRPWTHSGPTVAASHHQESFAHLDLGALAGKILHVNPKDVVASLQGLATTLVHRNHINWELGPVSNCLHIQDIYLDRYGHIHKNMLGLIHHMQNTYKCCNQLSYHNPSCSISSCWSSDFLWLVYSRTRSLQKQVKASHSSVKQLRTPQLFCWHSRHKGTLTHSNLLRLHFKTISQHITVRYRSAELWRSTCVTQNLCDLIWFYVLWKHREENAGSWTRLSLVRIAKTQQRLNHTSDGCSGWWEEGRWNIPEEKKSVRFDMFSGMLKKNRAWWKQFMVGCIWIDLGCQCDDWDHTLDRWPLLTKYR